MLRVSLLLSASLGIFVSRADPAADFFGNKLYFPLDPSRHRAPDYAKVEPGPGIFLLGFAHVMTSILPASLEAQLPALRAHGVTDLVIEEARGSEDCATFRSIARGHRVPEAFAKKWEIAYGPNYYALLRAARASGIEIVCGERRDYGQGRTDATFFHARNEYLAWGLYRMWREGRRPLLLIGAFHVNPVRELVAWLARAEGGEAPVVHAYHANEIDGRYQPSEGLLYPDIDFMIRQIGLRTDFRVESASRDPLVEFADFRTGSSLH